MVDAARIEALEAEVANLKLQLAQLVAAPKVEHHYHYHYDPTPAPALLPLPQWQWTNICQATATTDPTLRVMNCG